MSDAAEPPQAEPDEPPNAEYTIDELARITKVPSRTIRFYQSKKALPPPRLSGRVAYYDDTHVSRLELIATLQDRGLRLSAIRDLLARMDTGEVSVSEWLGLDEQLRSPWAQDSPRIYSESELVGLAEAEPRPGLIADLTRVGLVERQGDGFLARSPALLRVALELERAGVDVPTAASAAELIRKSLSRLAEDLTRFFMERAGSGFGRDTSSEELGKALEALRPLSQEAVKLIFSQEIERALRRLVESGGAANLPKRRHKR